jgi:hypothetical protein
MGDFDAPGVPDGAEHWLLVVPTDPAQVEAMLPAEGVGRGCGDAAVDKD